jgi:hypothetical protein
MKPYYYIYRTDENRGPKIQHPTLEEAQIEAERLSDQHPGGVFEILKAIAIVRCTLASTFWMDGETPSKLVYRALSMSEVLEEGDQLMSSNYWIPAVNSIGIELGKTEFPAARRPL